MDGQADYPDIAEGTSETSLAPHFTVLLDQSIACGTTIDFTFDIHCSEGNFNNTFSDDIGLTTPGSFTLISEDFEGSWGPQDDNPPAGWTIEDHGDESTPTWPGAGETAA